METSQMNPDQVKTIPESTVEELIELDQAIGRVLDDPGLTPAAMRFALAHRGRCREELEKRKMENLSKTT
jgi:hypothetical protein